MEPAKVQELGKEAARRALRVLWAATVLAVAWLAWAADQPAGGSGGKPGQAVQPPPAPPLPGGQAEAAGRENLVSNGSFEEGLKGWRSGAGAPGKWAKIDASAAAAGKQSVRLSAPRAGINPWIEQQFALPKPPAVLRVSFQARRTARASARVLLRLVLLSESGAEAKRGYLQLFCSDVRRWEQAAAEVALPPEAHTARLAIILAGVGEAWIDDVRAECRQVGMLAFPRRLAVQAGAPAEVHLNIVGSSENVSAAVDGQRAEVKASGNSVSLSLPALKPGRHRIELRAGQVRDRVEVWAAALKKPALLDNRGWFAPGGRPELLLVAMHSSPAEAAEAAARKFNAIQILPVFGRDAMVGLLRGFRAAPVRLVLTLPADPMVRAEKLGQALEALREAAADKRVAAVLMADMPDAWLADESAPALYSQLRSADALHPLAVRLSSPEAAGFWSHLADMLLVDCCRAKSAEEVNRRVKAAETAAPWQHIGAVLPLGWSQTPATQPAPQVARQMAFAALAAGAKSIWWYCVHHTGWDARRAKLWAALDRLHEELARTAAAIAPCEKAGDVAVKGAAAWGAWAKRDAVFLIVVAGQGKGIEASLKRRPAETQTVAGSAKVQVGEAGVKIELPARGVWAGWVKLSGAGKANERPSAGH